MWNLIKRTLFLFDAETAHDLSRIVLKAQSKISLSTSDLNKISYELPGGNFLGTLNPVGLAAGFDKNAELVAALPHFGFGYAEIGTVTPRPQGGNEKPRLFRDIPKKSLFNRMGFNNLGATLVAKNLETQKKSLPEKFKVGVNIGKNKATSDEDSHLDYGRCAETFLNLADYLVINVSSPNTPGLRNLQNSESLKPIINSVQEQIAKAHRKIPLLIKLAPELANPLSSNSVNHLTDSDLTPPLVDLVAFIESQGLDGIILTNTLSGTYIYEGTPYQGGWSGAVLKDASRQALRVARRATKLPIISVGGIDSSEEASNRLSDGAQSTQLYSSWIFEGPGLPKKILGSLRLK